MKLYIRYFTATLFVIFTSFAPHSHADRLEANTLSDCIAKADIIAYGTVSKFIQGEKNDTVVMDDFGCLKGTFDKETIRILFPKLNIEGPISVKARGTYFFFLKKAPTTSGHYEMFNKYDGVVQYSGPVFGEIITKLGLIENSKETSNPHQDPFMNTSGDEVEALGTQGHP